MYKDVIEIREILAPIFKKHNVRNAVLFGSYAKGQQTEKSDLDVAVDSGLGGLSFFGLLEDVCNTVNIPVDLIDTQEIVPDGDLDRGIKRTGIKIYG